MDRQYVEHTSRSLVLSADSDPIIHSTKVTVSCKSCSNPIVMSFKNLKALVTKESIINCRPCSIKSVWDNGSYDGKIDQKKIWSNPDLLARAASNSKAVWESEVYRKKQTDIHSDESYLKKTRLESTKLWEDDGFRASQKLVRSTDEWKNKQSSVMKELWSRDSYRNNVASGLSIHLSQKKRSSIEVITSNILDSLGISFLEEKNVGPYLFDFYLPDHDVYIECQGEYWHSFPRRIALDASKLAYLERAYPSSRLLYLNESDFINPEVIKSKVREFLSIQTDHVLNDFNLPSLKICSIDEFGGKNIRQKVREFFNSYHYAGFGRSPKAVYIVSIDDEIVASCKFSTPVRKEIATSMGLGFSEVLELDRFCIHPNRHKKNLASYVLSKVCKEVFKKYPSLKSLVSFADSTRGHHGSIYRASNWKLLSIVPPDYSYVNSDGWLLHKKTLYNKAVKMGMTESGYAQKHGYVKVFGRQKYKFSLERSA